MSAAITFDTDWAPDYAIQLAVEIVASRGIKTTWFVTHDSPQIRALRANPDLFEVGIHPNFMPGSSHGDRPERVLDACMQLVPDAVSMRTHGLVQSSALLDIVLHRTNMRYDVSLFCPLVHNLQVVDYVRFGRRLRRIPYFWEEDYAMEYPAHPDANPELWNPRALLEGGRGVQVFNFHPIHVFLNSATMGAYKGLKAKHPALGEAPAGSASEFINQTGRGTRIFLEELAEMSVARGGTFIRELGEA